jgi:sensor histidine kinase YesM
MNSTVESNRIDGAAPVCPVDCAVTAPFPHPMEVFPALRRIPQSIPRDMAYTALLALITTILFTLITYLNVPTESLSRLFVVNGVISLFIGYFMNLSSMAARRIILRWFPTVPTSKRGLLVSIISVLSGACGYWLGATVLGLTFRFWSGAVIVMMWIGGTLMGFAFTQRRLAESELAFARERNARIEAERLMTLSRLQTLQAQIEPHFLFNTLANVSSLIEIEPKQARKMLDQFTLLLRASLDQTRKATTALRAELQVVEAYLSVLKIRMGDRLSFRIESPPELQAIEVPSMLLQPIVENAVKHGIEPRVQGGSVHVSVRREGDQLELLVCDDGIGFVATSKDNVGLGAIRERLAMQFGDRASLQIERADTWTRVAIRIPIAGAN